MVLPEINTETRFVTLLGTPLGQSYAAGMQNRVYAAMGLNMVYFYTETDARRLPEIVAGLRHMPFAGFAVTKPNKIAILPLLDRLDPLCAAVGACNTVVFTPGGQLVGYNTDADGFLSALREETGFEIPGSEVFCIGAGGVGRAVCAALAFHGARRIHITDISEASARALADSLEKTVSVAVHPPGDYGGIADCGLVVNASGVGMGDTAGTSPLPSEYINRHTLYYDCCYNPPKTRFLQDAEQAGAAAVNGLGMSLWQGARQIELWSGQRPPMELMRQALREAAAAPF